MKSVIRNVVAMLATVSAGALGCADPAGGAPVNDIDGIDYDSLGGVAGNGLSPAMLQAALPDLAAAARARLVEPGSAEVSSDVLSTGILDDEAGRVTFAYAMRCALDLGEVVSGGAPPASYPGGGVMATLEPWRAGALSIAAQEDLFACVAMHLNAYGNHVPLLFSGESTRDGGTSGAGRYSFAEAVWQARLDEGGRITVHVFPQADLIEACGEDLEASITAQVCGGASGCGLVIRRDFAAACSGGGGVYSCDGAPALLSRLRPADVGLRHPACAR
ncbi:MAG: hypothetical protein IT372_16600 [Polyangiaceae bacterium]|nr:hypothetical protein [Polyangiaceae bacterium]